MSHQSDRVVADPAAEAAPDADASPQLFYIIESSDHTKFKVSQLAIKQSETLNNLIETMGYTDENAEKKAPIPLDNITGDILRIVFKWCEHHKGEPIPVNDDSVPKINVIPEFDKKLLQIDNMKLFHLMCAADYLNIKSLLHVSAKKVANMTKGKSLEELRKFLEIPSDEEDEAEQRAAARNAAGEAPNGDAGEGTSNT